MNFEGKVECALIEEELDDLVEEFDTTANEPKFRIPKSLLGKGISWAVNYQFCLA